MHTTIITEEDSEIISAQPASVEFMRDGDSRDAAAMNELAADLTSYSDRQFAPATRGMSFSERMDIIG